jgi:hypothetical protein
MTEPGVENHKNRIMRSDSGVRLKCQTHWAVSVIEIDLAAIVP